MSFSSFIPLIASAVGAAANYGISSAANKRAKQAQQQQVKDQQMLNAQAKQDQLEMWKKTNFKEQRAELQEAGLNAGLLYGMGGAGGATTGAPSAGSASKADTYQMQTPEIAQLGLMTAQKELIEAQTEKAKAETTKTAGVDTKESEARTTAQEFQNELNKEIGIEEYRRNYGWASDKLQTESEKANADWETYKATGYQGKAYNDRTSPVAKALEAGWDKTLEELKEAKTNNNIKNAEQTVKEFEARLAEKGIHPQSPWYVKLIGDLLEKAGLFNLLQ